MREIKFRAWSKSKGVFKGFSHLLEYVDMETGKPFYVDADGVKEYEDDAIVMQYTGLKDKNGVEIYEGDIVSTKYGNGSVFFWQGYGCWAMQNLESEFMGRPWGHRTLEHCLRWPLEVIGNIYENPELLKGGQ